MTINAKDLKSIKADLTQRRKARLAAADDSDLSTKETILRLAPELRRMKRQGFTTAELVEVLKKHGLGIKGATLNRYLAESQPHKGKTAKGQNRNQEDAATATPSPTVERPAKAIAEMGPPTKVARISSASLPQEDRPSAADPPTFAD